MEQTVEQKVQSFIDANPNYRPELLVNYYMTNLAILGTLETDEKMATVWNELTQGDFWTEENTPRVELCIGNQIVTQRLDLFDILFKKYKDHYGEFHTLACKYYDVPKDFFDRCVTVSEEFAAHIGLPQFELYQRLHNIFHDVKHIVRKGNIEEDEIEFYKFIFKDGGEVTLYNGAQHAVDAFIEESRFAA